MARAATNTCYRAPTPLLAAKLKELKLGVKTNLVENVEVLVEWFKTI